MYTLICITQDLGLLALFILGCVWKQWELIVFPIIIFFLIPFFNEIIYNIFAKLLFSEQREREKVRDYHLKQNEENEGKVLPILYDHRYNVSACGIEKLHPFDSVKYGRVFNILKEKGLIIEKGFIQPNGKVGRGVMLNLGVSQCYLLNLNYAVYVSKCVEIPLFFLPASFLRWRVLDPMMYATQGSIEASVLALKRGWSINLSGGYHHACRYSGGGFCIYPDICLAIEYLRKFGGIKKCMIIDLDAHQGNGHERDFIDDKENTFIMDFYNHSIYPGDVEATRGISYNKNVDYSTTDKEYTGQLKKALRKHLDEFQPEFVLYNAGTDCLAGDRLGQMNLSRECIIDRDQIVFEECMNRNIPLTMVLSGGYQKINAPIIADSILNLDKTLNIRTYHHQQGGIKGGKNQQNKQLQLDINC